MAGQSTGAGKTPLDMAMAGLAAASVGFVIFAMPDTLFADLVQTSGLPAILPAAEPPLGLTARLAVVVVAAVGVFFLVSLLLRALGQQALVVKGAASTPKLEVERAPEPAPQLSGRRRSFIPAEEEAPRIRRADAHPDAPARRPLFAGSDLGEPLDEIEVSYGDEGWNDEFAGEDEPLPGFMAGEPAPLAEPVGEFDPMLAAEAPEAFEVAAEAEPVDDFLSEAAPREPIDIAPEPEPVAEFEPEPFDVPAFSPKPFPFEAVAEEPAPIEEEPVVSALPIEPVRHPESRDQGEATIAELMQRLERGIQRRSQASWQSPEPTAFASEPEDIETPEESSHLPVDDRLRSALDDLQKMASRGGQA